KGRYGLAVGEPQVVLETDLGAHRARRAVEAYRAVGLRKEGSELEGPGVGERWMHASRVLRRHRAAPDDSGKQERGARGAPPRPRASGERCDDMVSRSIHNTAPS